MDSGLVVESGAVFPCRRMERYGFKCRLPAAHLGDCRVEMAANDDPSMSTITFKTLPKGVPDVELYVTDIRAGYTPEPVASGPGFTIEVPCVVPDPEIEVTLNVRGLENPYSCEKMGHVWTLGETKCRLCNAFVPQAASAKDIGLETAAGVRPLSPKTKLTPAEQAEYNRIAAGGKPKTRFRPEFERYEVTLTVDLSGSEEQNKIAIRNMEYELQVKGYQVNLVAVHADDGEVDMSGVERQET